MALALTVVLLTGCRTYQQQGESMAYKWESGNYAGAAAEYGSKANSESSGRDAIIWRLEHATTLRSLGQFRESNAAFSQAEDRINHYEATAKVKLANEAGAMMTTLANLPYEGRAYDKIMLNTYKALNYLNLGEPDNARVELIRAYQRQQDAVEENRKRIEKAQEEVRHRSTQERKAINHAESDSAVRARLDSAYQDLDRHLAYGDYVNPFTVFMDALFFMYNNSGGSDLERANKSLERMVAFAGNNKFLRQDAETLKTVSGSNPQPTTYVLFETGRAADRDQIRIDVPILVARVSYVGTAFPVLKYHENRPAFLTVTAGNTRENTEPVCVMDNVIATDFKAELPTIITKTIASTVVKALMNYGVNTAAEQGGNDMLTFGVRILTAAAQAAVNIADTRTWTTLPKEFQYCRVPTPPDRRLQLSVPNGLQKQDILLQDGMVNVVCVRAVGSGSPLAVSQFKLK
ncbi:MAG: hypothetical protein WCO56_12505 [Verrucomicrobiota bacterium]